MSLRESDWLGMRICVNELPECQRLVEGTSSVSRGLPSKELWVQAWGTRTSAA